MDVYRTIFYMAKQAKLIFKDRLLALTGPFGQWYIITQPAEASDTNVWSSTIST